MKTVHICFIIYKFVYHKVVLADNETIEHGEQISKDLMEKLEITKDSLIPGAYMDLLLKK